jgi:LysM repeat protein
MSFFGKWNPVILSAVFIVAATGCSPDQGPMDEEKEPHFVLGKSRVNAFDYPGAIEAFEESLEANPHSAQAHFQLAMLYENQDSVADPAAAIYHYQEYLKYAPNAGNADLIRQRVATCKQQLAENVLQLPSAPAVQQQLEKLTEENRRLHDQLSQWQAYYAAQQAAKTNQVAQQNNYNYNNYSAGSGTPQQATSLTPDDVTALPDPHATTSASGTSNTVSTTSSRRNSTSSKVTSPKTSKPHTHTVTSGETLASIARKQGVSINALEEANPYVNPKKLKAGQVLNLPTQ